MVLAVDAELFQAASEGGLLVVDVSHLTRGTMAPRAASTPFKWTFDGIHCLPPVFIQAAREVLSMVVYAEEADEPGLASTSTARDANAHAIHLDHYKDSVEECFDNTDVYSWLPVDVGLSQRQSHGVALGHRQPKCECYYCGRIATSFAGFSEPALAESASSANKIIVLSCAAINECFIFFVCWHRVVGWLSACSRNYLEVSISPTQHIREVSSGRRSLLAPLRPHPATHSPTSDLPLMMTTSLSHLRAAHGFAVSLSHYFSRYRA